MLTKHSLGSEGEDIFLYKIEERRSEGKRICLISGLEVQFIQTFFILFKLQSLPPNFQVI